MTDAQFLDRIRAGDERSLEELYRKYYRMMVGLVVRNSGSEEEAQDVYQDALIVLWQKVRADELVLTSKLSTYLYSICQNLWRKELERKRRLTSSENRQEEGEEMDHDRQERIRIVRECIDSLGETCRKVLQHYYFEKMSMAEIAEQLGFANADTAKTKKYKCKKELDEIIKSKYSASDFLD